MSAIFKREFRSYLTNISGGIFVAVSLAIMGVMLYAVNLFGASPQMEYGLFGSVFACCFTIPAISAISYPSDKKTGNDKFLLSLPIGSGKIALAKYLAVLCWFSIPVAVMCLAPLLLGGFGSVIYSASYTAIFGYFLVGACMISVCMFIRTLFNSHLIAGVVGAAASALLYFGPSLADLLTNKLLYKIISLISPFARFSDFLYGILDIPGVIYLLSVTVAFVFCSAWSVDKKRG